MNETTSVGWGNGCSRTSSSEAFVDLFGLSGGILFVKGSFAVKFSERKQEKLGLVLFCEGFGPFFL